MSSRWTFCLALVVLTVGCGHDEPMAPATGLTGVVLLGPTRPACPIGDPCEAPFSATFEITKDHVSLATFRSDSQGRFTVALPPGEYVLVPGVDAPLLAPGLQTKSITVGTNGLTSLELRFDTGIAALGNRG